LALSRVGADRDRRHQAPADSRDAIPPRGLRIALRAKHIIHPLNGEGNHRVWLSASGNLHRRPKLRLQFCGSGVDPRKLLPIPSIVKSDTLIEISQQQRPHLRCVGRRQQTGPCVFRADGVGLFFLVIFVDRTGLGPLKR